MSDDVMTARASARRRNREMGLRDMHPLITVVTPSFNQGRYLRQCIDSVLQQRYPNLQYIVLDGGSTDETVDVLRSYGDAIRWRSQRDRGQAAAINEGFRLAEGEILAWLNSDDYYLPHTFERAVERFSQHAEAAIVYGRAVMVDQDGRTIRPYPTFAFSRRDLVRKCYVCQPAVFIRKTVVDEVGLLNEQLDICCDYEWWLRIGRDHKLVFCNHELAATRQYRTTKTASRRLRALVEAGYLMRHHFGRASWRWSAKWVVHRWALDRRRFVFPLLGWMSAAFSARRYRRRFDRRMPPSPYGRKLLRGLSERDGGGGVIGRPGRRVAGDSGGLVYYC